ncbi:hypothetical protein T06_12411 [Trichinella sp. T6]|nr:hypothetical protein T06_12411 [Trichinella sp. T6]
MHLGQMECQDFLGVLYVFQFTTNIKADYKSHCPPEICAKRTVSLRKKYDNNNRATCQNGKKPL